MSAFLKYGIPFALATRYGLRALKKWRSNRRLARAYSGYLAHKRTMRGYRKKAARGLASAKVLSTIKDPGFSIAWPPQSKATYTYRFCPFAGYAPNSQSSGTSKWYHSVPQMDPRFRYFCDMYREFRIANMTISVKLQSNPYNDTYGFVSFVGKVIRNCSKTTDHTIFYSGGYPMFTPGIVWRRNNSNTGKLPGITLSVYPANVTERQQWYSTLLTELNECYFFTSGVETDFCPAIDVGCCFTRTPTSSGSFAVAIQMRCTFVFRDPFVENDSATPNEKVLEITRDDVIDLSNQITMQKQLEANPPIQAVDANIVD